MKLQRLGGYAAIAGVCCQIIFFIILRISRLGTFADWVMDAAKTMAAFSAAPSYFVVLFLLNSILFILVFVVFLALHERMQADAVHLTRIMLIVASASIAVNIASFFVLLWGGAIAVAWKDVSAFKACLAVFVSLVAMGHQTFGWACLLQGCAILKTRSFSRILGWLGLFAGILYVLAYLVPRPSHILHGIGLLSVDVGTVWIGIALLRQKEPQAAAKAMTAS